MIHRSVSSKRRRSRWVRGKANSLKQRMASSSTATNRRYSPVRCGACRCRLAKNCAGSTVSGAPAPPLPASRWLRVGGVGETDWGRYLRMAVPGSERNTPHTQAVRSKLADQYEPATANKMLSALRGVLKEAWRLGQVDAENYHRAVDLPSVRGESPLRGRALTAGELRKIAAVCAEDESPAGPRDAAMIALSTAGGLRRSEIINLEVKDYDPETGALTIRRGKGRKPRVCYATNGAADALADWLQLRGLEPGALFCPVQLLISHWRQCILSPVKLGQPGSPEPHCALGRPTPHRPDAWQRQSNRAHESVSGSRPVAGWAVG